MCGRFAMFLPLADIVARFGLEDAGETRLEPRYNIAPTQPIAAIRADAEGVRSLDMLRWGLIPHWAKDASIGNRLINARAETVAEKPAFRQSFSKRRCLILASGFYEWGQTPDGKFPFFMSPPGGECLAFAGLWERWRSPEEELIESCVIITTNASQSLARVHDRMPAILDEEAQLLWLAQATRKEDCQALLGSTPDGRLEIRQVSRAVNNPRNEGADLIKEAASPG
jgi:putative SOS response-associated peptidase YedK